MRAAAVLALASAASALAFPWSGFNAQKVVGGPVTPQSSWSFNDCGLPTDIIQIESLTISPDPPVPGQDLTVKVTAFVTETVEEGAHARVVVKLGLVKLLTKDFDVCEEARNNNATVQCPIEPGQHYVEQTVALPKEIPPAAFTVSVNGYSVNDEDLMCAVIKADFRKKPF